MSNTKAVDLPSKAVNAMRERWELIDDLMGGQLTMLKAGQRWMPSGSLETPKDYERRLKLSVLNPGFSQTVKTFVGKPFSSPIVLSGDMPEKIKVLCKDIDCCGNSLDVFARNVFQDAILHGVSYILVDHTKSAGAETLADEQAQGARPYWVHIKAHQMLGWQSKKVNNIEQLTRVRILEHVNDTDQADDHNWDDDDIKTQVRVLYPDRYEIWRKVGNDWSIKEKGENSLGKIPIVPVYANKTGFMQGLPPLEDLANINLAHWISTSEQNNILHVVRVPFLFGKGFKTEDFNTAGSMDSALALDSSRAFITTNTDATLQWIEHEGRAIEVGRQSLANLTEQMSIIGTQKLVKNPGNVTATGEAIVTSESSSDLGVMSMSTEHALNQAIGIAGDWYKIDKPGRVDISPDWKSFNLNEQDNSTILSLRASGDLSHDKTMEFFITRKVFDEDFNIDENKAQLEKEREEMYKPVLTQFPKQKDEQPDNLSNDEDTTATTA